MPTQRNVDLKFEITLEDGRSTTISGGALIDAWGAGAPEAAAQALDLCIGGSAVLCDVPHIEVRRLL